MPHEQEHIRRIVQLEPAINRLFDEFIWQLAPHLGRVRLDRPGIWSANPTIKAQVDQALKEFAAKYKDLLQRYMADAWQRSETKNDELLLKFITGLGVVLGARFLLKTFNLQLPPAGGPVTLDSIVTLSRNTAARDAFFKNRLEQTISARVWNLMAQNKTLILNCVSSGVLEGKSAAAISRELRKYLREPNNLFRRVRDPETGALVPSKAMRAYHPGQGVYRSSYKNALRLARNETNMAYRAADMDRWQNTDFVLGYEVKLSGSHPVFDICDSMAGQYPKTFTFVGWHPQCYCFAVPILPPKDEFLKHLKNDTRITGHVKDIPTRARQYVQGKTDKILAMKTRPYWVDNFKIDGKKLKLNLNKSNSYAK